MNMVSAIDTWLRTAGFEVTETDAVDMLEYLVHNTDTDSASLFKLEVAACRKREYQAELMRNRRRALLREKLSPEEGQ